MPGGFYISHTIAAMPAFNEERYIARIILNSKKHVDNVVVVDDGSSDYTAQIAEAMGAHVIRHEKNQGYGAALRSCFKTARELNATEMVIIDSDGQHDPDDIPKLLEPLGNGADLVIGSRFLNGNGKNIPAYRKVGMKVLDTATNFAAATNVSDTQSGYRAYGKKAIEKISINDDDMSAGSEILMQVNKHDLAFKEVEIHCNYNVDKTSTQNPVSHGVKVLVKILKDIELKRPLFYFTVPGLILTVIGILVGVILLQIVSAGGQLPFGPTLFVVITILIGTFSAFTGIILHSMARLSFEFNSNNKSRTKYIYK